jgi:hypothetical protein
VCDTIVIDGNSPTVAVLTLSQQTLDPIVQMFEIGLGPTPTQPLCFRWPLRDSLSPNSPAAFVSSVAAVNNGGVLVDPNAPAAGGVIDSRFMNTLGHLPAATTLAGFEGLTNEQAFSAFVNSDTVSAVVGASINSYVPGVLGSILQTVHFIHST